MKVDNIIIKNKKWLNIMNESTKKVAIISAAAVIVSVVTVIAFVCKKLFPMLIEKNN